MKKYLPTAIFYAVSFVVVYVLNIVSPGQHDGGPGVGAFALILLVLTSILLVFVNLFKGFGQDKSRLILAGIHLLVLVLMFGIFFI